MLGKGSSREIKGKGFEFLDELLYHTRIIDVNVSIRRHEQLTLKLGSDYC